MTDKWRQVGFCCRSTFHPNLSSITSPTAKIGTWILKDKIQKGVEREATWDLGVSEGDARRVRLAHHGHAIDR